ncbi:MAG: ABC transporter substrate-binding protein [Ilumatobacteraceae bacterium]
MLLAACSSDDTDSSSDSTETVDPVADTTASTEPSEQPIETTTASSEVVESTEDVSTESSAPADDPLGEPSAATGDPVKIGLITEAGGDALSAQSQLTEDGANIAVQYVNEYRNGLGGHPIELFVCGNAGSPAGASDCANQMVEQDVAAVVWPFTGFGSQEVPIITGAGIPVVAVTGSSIEELTAPNAFILTGGFPGVLGAYAQDSADKGIGSFAMIVTDVPAATQAAQGIGDLVFGNAGVEYTVIPVAPGTPDLTAQLQGAVSGGAEAVGVTGDVTFCTSWFQAYQTLGLDLPKYIIAPCIDPTVIESLGDVLNGSILATTQGEADADLATYAAMVDKYGTDVDPNPTISAGISSGVGSIMNLSNLFAGYSGDVTAPIVIDKAKDTADVPLWLSGGLTFTCDGTAIAILPNICSAQFQIGTVDAEGMVSDVRLVDASALFTAS